jgi:S1-C subfamily serine protease
LLLPALAALLAWPSAYAAASRLDPAEKETLKLTPAVVLIKIDYTIKWAFEVNIQEKKGGPITKHQLSGNAQGWVSGSGFIYRPDGYLITNGHVVGPANLNDHLAQDDFTASVRSLVLPSVVQDVAKLTGRDWTGHEEELARIVNLQIAHSEPKMSVYLANHSSYLGEIKAYSEDATKRGKDVAIVKIDGNNLPTVRLGDSDNIHIQEPIRVIGFPGVASALNNSQISVESVLVPTVTNGHVSAVKVDFKGFPVIQSDAAITHGNSGGPAFNYQGDAIGIGTYGSEGSVAGFNFFVPINTALEFVRQVGAKPEQGLFDSLWADALDTYDAGKCETSKEKLDDVLRIMPNEPDATRLYAAAEGCAASEGPVGRMMESAAWMIWGGAGLLLVLLLVAALLMMRGKKPVAAPAMAGAPGIGPGGAPKRVDFQPQPGLPPAAEHSFGSIQVTSGSLSGRRFPVTKAGLLLGRDVSKCQVVFTEDVVSGEHAWIVPMDNGVVVIDRGSSNGTFINSVESPRVGKVGLQNGDRIYLGKKGSVVVTYFAS